MTYVIKTIDSANFFIELLSKSIRSNKIEKLCNFNKYNWYILNFLFDDAYNFGMAAISNKGGHRNVFLRVPVESLDARIGISVIHAATDTR